MGLVQSLEHRVRCGLTATTDRLIHAHDRHLDRFMSINPLLGPFAKHFSQNDEDGITLRILQRIGLTTPSTFLEIGVGDGRENNTLVLLACGWTGAWIGNEPLAFSAKDSRVNFTRTTVTRENCVDLSKQGADLTTIAVASIDIDGNDYHVAKTLMGAGLRPELLIVEYNATFPPGVPFIMPYADDHVWAGDNYCGASLESWCRLLQGYRLVACNLTGSNAFFVRSEHSAKFDDVPTEQDRLFVPGVYLTPPLSGHAPSLRTIEAVIR